MSDIQVWTLAIVFCTFLLYIGIAIWSRASSTGEFYIAGKGVPAVANGMATAADWMSAASFISMAGLIAFSGRDGSRYLMGWTGGYVLLALLLAPYLRRFGKFTVPDFVGDRYYSTTARLVAVLCALFVSFTYVVGQMGGVGIVFARFLEIETWQGVVVGMFIVFFYAVLGGMKGITYTQVAQYCVLIFAFMVPAIFISIQATGIPIPQLGFGASLTGTEMGLLEKLNGLSEELGFTRYTDGSLSTANMLCITAALMLGTAGLPHVIVRFYTVKKVSDARLSAFYALLFIAILYTTAPAVAAFARTNLLAETRDLPHAEAPSWFTTWENIGLIEWDDKNNDGLIQYTGPRAAEFGLPENELTVSPDIMVLANPEIAGLPDWVVGLVAAGALAAALSTAAGLLLVISTAFAHDLVKKVLIPDLSEKMELFLARIGAGAAVIVAGWISIDPPGFVGEVVAFAFGLAASSFFPVILLGIFWKRMNREGAIAGMLSGILFTGTYIIYFKMVAPALNTADNWWFGISPEGIGTIGMLVNFAVAITVAMMTPPPPERIRKLVDRVRLPQTHGG